MRLALVAIVVTACAACGQKGPLYLPSDPEARDRASWPETLKPYGPMTSPSAPSEPARQP